MKKLNGTITLSYVEEDNKQRVIFRVIPLCTREGTVFHGGAEDFPDEGSLRIVPDKREQSTFKERMREIGSLCVVQLLADGRELCKVRANRNYAPDSGERNQFAIYSDVICEFTPDGCFEVLELGADGANALTPRVLLHKDKMLYGPVERAEAMAQTVDGLKPFGDDRYLLHTIDTPALGQHRICWDPDATLSWRQRRGTLRRRERAEETEASAETAPEAASEKPREEAKAADLAARESDTAARAKRRKKDEPVEQAEEAAKRAAAMDARTRRAERAAQIIREEEKKKAAPEQVEEQPAASAAPVVEAESEAALPIGTHLEILDNEMPFEQQISRLAQPLSQSANRLGQAEEQPAEDDAPEEATAHFNGTPLMPPAAPVTKSLPHPETMHHVVERQMRHQRDPVMGDELGETIYRMIENPIDTLQGDLDYVWQNAEMREQAITALLQNETFVRDMTRALRRNGLSLQANAAAQEQLAEIEAERLSLLMQLDAARDNERKYREDAIRSVSKNRREEVERLKREIADLEAKKRSLSEAVQALSNESAERVTDFLAEKMTCLSAAGEQRVLLSPVLGETYEPKALADKLRIHMNDSGFSLSDDDAVSLLIHFSLCDALCLRARTIADARLFAEVLLESFGLQSVSAVVAPGSYVEMISLLPEDTRRTPTVTIQPLGTETMVVYGHKTIYLADETELPAELDALAQYPVIHVPPVTKRAFVTSAEWQPVAPAALSTFAGIRADTHPMLSEAEKWFADLKRDLHETELVLPDAMLACMRRFIEVASRHVRGGFLSAADNAVCHWVLPQIALKRIDPTGLMNVLADLPKALEQLGGK